MFEKIFKGGLKKATIIGTANDGFSFQLPNGEIGMLAIVDSKGKVIESGDAVAQEAWNTAWRCFVNFWKGEGYLKVTTGADDAKQT